MAASTAPASKSGLFADPREDWLAQHSEEVIDPTGAGDSFAGGILGFLAADDQPAPGRLREAMAYGTVIASLTVEGFGLDRLKRADRMDVEARLAKFRAMLSF